MTMQFQLPDLGEGITEAELVRWLVKPGDQVTQDQAIAEVLTDKAMVELPSPIAGTIRELNVTEGQIVPVQTVLLTIGAEVQDTLLAQEAIGSAQNNTQTTNIAQQSKTSVTSAHEVIRENVPSLINKTRRTLATPVARRMARELGINITTITGSGPNGRVRTQDVQELMRHGETNGSFSSAKTVQQTQRASSAPNRTVEIEIAERQHATPRATSSTNGSAPLAASPPAQDQDEERIPLRGLRRRIAENMVRSVSTIPQVTSMVEVDATGLVTLRQSLQATAAAQGVKLSYLPFIIKALVHALHLYPYINATIDNEQIVLKHTYHIGIATATPDGLLVPVLRSADQLTILEIAHEIRRLAKEGRERRLQLHELRGSGFTISNYGTIGGFFSTPIINPGESGILGLGQIAKRPWVVDDRIEIRPILPLSFTADHRLVDGEMIMRFLNTLVASLEHPHLLLLNMR
jgi:pyruvate dehydrogenase E2 component (dihydrolipoamide acetyltransferase)